MRALICDRCGAMWKDEHGCDIQVSTIFISKGGSHSDKVGEWDLCDRCKEGLFGYLNPLDDDDIRPSSK